MGWTTHTEYAGDPAWTPKRYWKEIFLPDVPNWYRDEPDRCEVVAENSYGKEFYAAIHDKKRDVTFCLVALIVKDKHGISIKDMDNSMGPFYYHASKKVLNALSEPDNEDDKEWREKCLETMQQTKTKKELFAGLKDGNVIKFIRPYHIDGKEHDTFRLVDKKNQIFSCDGVDGRFRLQNWRKISFTILS